MVKQRWKWLIRLSGIVILTIILFNINISATLETLLDANLILLILSILLIFPQIVMRAWRWHIIMRMQNIDYSLKDAVIVYFSGLFLGTITPGRVGDFIKVQYLREEGHSFGKSFLSVFLDRGYDLAVLIGVGYISIIYFIQLFSTGALFISTLLVLIPIIGLLFYILGIIKNDIIIEIISFFSPHRYKDVILKTVNDFFRELSCMKFLPLVYALLITIFTWILYFTMSYCFAQSLSIPISFLYLSGCVSISAFITLLPLSISGIGTRDATFILFFSYVGISSESAVAFSVLILLMYVVNGFLGFIAWQIKPIDLEI